MKAIIDVIKKQEATPKPRPMNRAERRASLAKRKRSKAQKASRKANR